MDKQLLKSGNGRLWGVSTYKDQPGKVLILSDGTTTICHLTLDKALPGQIITIDGKQEAGPGVLLDYQFVTNLQTETDGEVEIYWQ